MKIGILGLPASGKTTIFNSLTRGKADVGGFGATRSANIGVAHVPDERAGHLGDGLIAGPVRGRVEETGAVSGRLGRYGPGA